MAIHRTISRREPRPAPTTASNPRPITAAISRECSEHLPYLKDLGVTTLWLTPLYQNDDGSSDYHGYGAVDEYAVEDHFGNMQDFQNLVAAAHQLGMKVLFDMVPEPRRPASSLGQLATDAGLAAWNSGPSPRQRQLRLSPDQRSACGAGELHRGARRLVR